MAERTATPHDFWLATCGLDTHRKSPNHARLDTPWNAFTADGRALVCTIWTDLIVEVHDPQLGRTRRFEKMGGRSERWRGVGEMPGEPARETLDRAIAGKLPVFGYEAEPNAGALERGVRSVKHFYLDRVHQLKGWIGLSLDRLDRELQVHEAFRRHPLVAADDPNLPPTIFELVDVTADVPGQTSGPADGNVTPSEEDELDQALEGSRTAEEYARLALPVLVEHVLQQTDDVLVPITYQRLAELIGRRNKHGVPWARGLGHVLGRVTSLIDSVASRLSEVPPYLTTVVVLSSGANAGLPDKGVSGRWHGYDLLSRDEMKAKVDAEYQRILRFGSRWNDVLRALGLSSIAPDQASGKPQARGGWAGGESEQHKALKRYVREHPEQFGAGADWFAQEEYVLRSLDELDVMFKGDRHWVGIEVKSRVSDRLPRDYERGLYQVVKYRAVLEAQARVDHPRDPPSVRVLLVLESTLPVEYRQLAVELDVEYVETVGPGARREERDVAQLE